MRLPEIAPESAGSAHGVAIEYSRAWLDCIAIQVDECLARDSVACVTLLSSIDGLLSAARASGAADRSLDDELASVIVAVQFHDRLIQQLTHVAESLRAINAHLGDPRRATSSAAWESLSTERMQAFTMRDERMLFAGTDAGFSQAHRIEETADAIELFTDDLAESR